MRGLTMQAKAAYLCKEAHELRHKLGVSGKRLRILVQAGLE